MNRRIVIALGWLLLSSLCLVLFFLTSTTQATWIWVEGEKPSRSTMHRHPYWYDLIKHEQVSGGDLISNFADEPGQALYRVLAPSAGEYDFWVRANPVQSRLSYRLNDGAQTLINLEKEQSDSINIAADGKIDLRFLAWVHIGKVTLKKGENNLRFVMNSPNHNHGYLDCFVLTNEPFHPQGTLKPNQVLKSEAGWFAFDPKPDPFTPDNSIDLRRLNETVAGEGGPIVVKGSQFVHSLTQKPVRFWAVNGPSGKDRQSLRQEARILAKRGVNLVRVHHAYFDKKGDVDLAEIHHAIDVVEALKAEGIYSHFSIYFPLWLDPAPDNTFLKGYDGKTHAFAALYFNKAFQGRYRTWWKALLTTPSRSTGKRLIDDPAVFGAEIINEDSYFFWTFNDKNIPETQLRIVETQFGDWVTKKYGSIAAGFKAWGGLQIARDQPGEGRVGFRPLWNMAHEKILRDKDTATFLASSQRDFYNETYVFLKSLGFRGLVTASNWATASPEIFGPLEKYSYTIGDFIDRHGYFSVPVKGENSDWSIRDGHLYSDRSALRFDAEQSGKPKAFVHPSIDPSYDGKPSMISETTWNRPNRFRSEAPLFFAVYGSLQDSDAIVHFADDGAAWSVKPGYFMQPWTLMSPAMMGQFPAAALIYRQGLVAPGDVLADLNLKIGDLFDLKGTPLPQDAAFDELRLKDVPQGSNLRPGSVIDPLIHFAGRTNVAFTASGGPPMLKDLAPYINRKQQVVTSTTRELSLDYGKGLLTINAPSAQGASGNLRSGGTLDLKELTITSKLDLGHIIIVSLDGQPLVTSQKMLLQVMSEEKPSGFRTQPTTSTATQIVSIGHDPWLVRDIEGQVNFKRADAATLRVKALDANGDVGKLLGSAAQFKLDPQTTYYVIAP